MLKLGLRNVVGSRPPAITPPIPTLGTPTVISGTQINIPVTSSYPYEMWYSTDNVTYTKHGDGATTPYEATGLTAGTLYYFEARAKNGSKYSEFSTAANATTKLPAPTAFTSEFTVDTITGDLAWTDNVGGVATYEVYSNTNGAGDVLLATTAEGATSYGDTTCKQNASVVYKIRAKKGSVYSDYATATALVTPLCWKTNQTTLTTVTLNVLNIMAGKTVNVNWGDGTNNDYTGSAARTKDYSVEGNYNISVTGDVDFITRFDHVNQVKSSGNLTNWIFPTSCSRIAIVGCSFTGNIQNIVIPTLMTTMLLYNNLFTGKTINISSAETLFSLSYQMYGNRLSGTDTTVFRIGMTVFDIKNQGVSFLTAEIDKLLKAAADWYQINAPTQNCTFDMSGANMGIPTGGASNTDLVRLAGYYTAAEKTATIVVRTS